MCLLFHLAQRYALLDADPLSNALFFGTKHTRMWNRRYVDFLIRMATFEIPMNPIGMHFCVGAALSTTVRFGG